jgi:hypothetical protein
MPDDSDLQECDAVVGQIRPGVLNDPLKCQELLTQQHNIPPQIVTFIHQQKERGS